MTQVHSLMLLLGGAATLAGCSTAPRVAEGPSPRAQAELTRALAGRIAGPAVRCLPSHRTTNATQIDNWATLYRDGRTTYVQSFRGGCRGLGNGRYTLVTRLFGNNQLCDGDVAQLVDLQTGIGGGLCVFGPFVPYTRT